LKITAGDIRKQEFKKVMRGYDAVEVETFLELIADEFEVIQKTCSDLKSRVQSLESELEKYKGMEKNLKSTLTEAKESSNIEKEKVRKESEFLIKEAEIKAMAVMEDAQKKLNSLKEEIQVLNSQRASIAARLRFLLKSQIDLIKILEADDIPLDRIVRKKVKGSSTEKKKIIDQKKETAEMVVMDKKTGKPEEETALKEKPEKEEEKVATKEETPKQEKKESGEEKTAGKKDQKIVDGFNIIDKMILEKEKSEGNENKGSQE